MDDLTCSMCGGPAGKGSVTMSACLTLIDIGGHVHNLWYCYANGCAVKLLTPEALTHTDPFEVNTPHVTPPDSKPEAATKH